MNASKSISRLRLHIARLTEQKKKKKMEEEMKKKKKNKERVSI